MPTEMYKTSPRRLRLRELGEALEQNKYATLGSRHSFHQTTQIVADCWEAFTEINETIGGEKLVKGEDATSEKTSNAIAKFKQPSLSFKQRFQFPFKEPQINMLRSKLEILKSSLMLMLQVLLLAEQVRNRPKAPVSEEQKDLIKTLVDEKNARDLDFKRSCMAIEAPPSDKPRLKTLETGDSSTLIGSTPSETLVEDPATTEPRCLDTAASMVDGVARAIPTLQTHVSLPPHPSASEGSATSRPSLKWASSKSSFKSSSDTLVSFSADSTVPASLRIRDEEIQHHAMLVHNLLEEISDVQYRIDHGIRHRMHNGILKIHWDEWTPFASKHGHDHFHRVFEPHRHVARYWLDLHEGVKHAPITAVPTKKNVIHFKDALERRFELPFEQCQQWSDMMNLINHMFENEHKLKDSVLVGKYDLKTEDRRIVLPRLWDATIEPGMTIVMEMQPLRSFPPPPPPPPAPPLPRRSGHTLPSYAHQPILPPERPPPPPPMSALHSFRSGRHSARTSEAMKVEDEPEDSGYGLFRVPLKSSGSLVTKPTLGSWGHPPYFWSGQSSASGHPIALMPKSETQARAAPASVGTTPDTWPMKNVTDWLASNRYSSEWQAAFQNLRLDGINFLQLGVPQSGIMPLHSQIYPEMQRLYSERHISWDGEQVRTEGKRLRTLVTAIAQNTDLGLGPRHRRRSDDNYKLPALINEIRSVSQNEPDDMIQVRTTRSGPPRPTREAVYIARGITLGPASTSSSVSGSPSRSQSSYSELGETAFHPSDESLDELEDSSQRLKPNTNEVFDQAQEDLLKDQIFAFKLLSKNGILPPKLKEDLFSARPRQKSLSDDEIDAMLGSTSVTPLPNDAQPRRDQQPSQIDDHAFQDYQMQLMLLEQQNKKMLVLAKEQSIARPARPSLPESNVVLGAETDNKGNINDHEAQMKLAGQVVPPVPTSTRPPFRFGATDGRGTLHRVTSRLLQEDLKLAPKVDTKHSTPEITPSLLAFGSLQLTSPSRAADTSPDDVLSFKTRRPEVISHANSQPTAFEKEHSNEKGRCPHPGCGKVFKDLKAHTLTHQVDRPEKCPISGCECHEKGFARKYDKNRHALTHFDGTLVCGFCPGAGTKAGKSFTRVDIFKRHLTSVHVVEQPSQYSRKIVRDDRSTQQLVWCPSSTCDSWFSSAQNVYAHLDDCVLNKVTTKMSEANPSEHEPEQHSIEARVLRRKQCRRSRSAEPLPQDNSSYATDGGIDNAISLRVDAIDSALAGLATARVVNGPPLKSGDARDTLDARTYHRSRSLDMYKRNSKAPQVLSAKVDLTSTSDDDCSEEKVASNQPQQPKAQNYGWFTLFLCAGLTGDRCGKYAKVMANEMLNETVLPDIRHDTLRTLGLKEGDVLKVMKYLDQRFSRTSVPSAAAGGGIFSVPNGALEMIHGKSSAEVRKQVGGFDDDAWTIRERVQRSRRERRGTFSHWSLTSGSEADEPDPEPSSSNPSPTEFCRRHRRRYAATAEAEAELADKLIRVVPETNRNAELGSEVVPRLEKTSTSVLAKFSSFAPTAGESSQRQAEIHEKKEVLAKLKTRRERNARLGATKRMRWDYEKKKAWIEDSSTEAADPRAMLQYMVSGLKTAPRVEEDASLEVLEKRDADAATWHSAMKQVTTEDGNPPAGPVIFSARPNDNGLRRSEVDQDDGSHDEYLPFGTRALSGGYDGKMTYGAPSETGEDVKEEGILNEMLLLQQRLDPRRQGARAEAEA